MDLLQFRTAAYEILGKRGFKEIDGKIYYPEESVLDMLEYIQQKVELQGNIREGILAMFDSIAKKMITKPDQTGKK
jgi:hypothetical protein